MRLILCWAALGGVVFGALTAAWPAHAMRTAVWPIDTYRPRIEPQPLPVPIVKVTKKRLPKPKVERPVDLVPAETYTDVNDRAEARAAAERYAMAHRPFTITNSSK